MCVTEKSPEQSSIVKCKLSTYILSYFSANPNTSHKKL